MEYLPPLHPLWTLKLHNLESDPAVFIKLCKSHLMDVSDSLAIEKILDFVDSFMMDPQPNYHFTFQQFMVVAPFLLHHFVIQNKYYQSTTNKYLYSNSLQCKYKPCKYRMKIQINFQLDEVILDGVNSHSHELILVNNSHSSFIRSLFESFAKTGITSAPILIKGVKMTLGYDLNSEDDRLELQRRIGLNDIQQSYAYNVIERIKNDFDSKIKSIGEEFEFNETITTVTPNKKRKLLEPFHEAHNVWRLT